MLKFYLKVLPHTHANFDQDFKVIVLIFYLIDKCEFRRAILSGDMSCSIILINLHKTSQQC